MLHSTTTFITEELLVMCKPLFLIARWADTHTNTRIPASRTKAISRYQGYKNIQSHYV